MRSLLKISYNRVLPLVLFFLPLLCVAGPSSVSVAFELEDETKVKSDDRGRTETLDNLGFIELINSVETGSASNLIQKFQAKEGQTKLLNGKYNPNGECRVEAFRNKEVLLITIPAHLLFEPNMKTLKDSASEFLSPLTRYLKEPDMYRVILVMHTDNTGSHAYREQITLDRVNSVFDWFERTGNNTNFLFSFALGDNMPLKENDSMENRDANRRLEVYLMPGTKMVEQAKKGRISF